MAQHTVTANEPAIKALGESPKYSSEAAQGVGRIETKTLDSVATRQDLGLRPPIGRLQESRRPGALPLLTE